MGGSHVHFACDLSPTIHTCIPPTLANLSMTSNGDGLTAATKVWPYLEAIANYKCANVYWVLVHDYYSENHSIPTCHMWSNTS